MDLLDKGQLALYDRQIRVWGATSQAKVSKASVLIVDVGTMVAHEVAKNLTLAGIRELWLLELDKDVKAAEHRFIDQRGACLFFQRPTDSVKEDVKLMADKLKMLNPNLVVTLPATVTAVDLKAIDMLICCSTSYETAVQWNDRARQHDVKYIWAGGDGQYFGWSFCDFLSSYEYHLYSAKEDKIISETPIRLSFSSLSEFMQKQATFLSGQKQAIDQPSFRNLSTRQLSKGNLLEHYQNLYHCLTQYFALSVPDSSPCLVKNMDDHKCDFPLAPVAAVVGGQAAQDALRGITCNDQPVFQFFLYDGHMNIAMTHT